MNEDEFANRPDAKCPKCGHQTGFASGIPRYDAGDSISTEYVTYRRSPGWLVWTCRFCGYWVRTATADGVEVAPDVEVPDALRTTNAIAGPQTATPRGVS